MQTEQNEQDVLASVRVASSRSAISLEQKSLTRALYLPEVQQKMEAARNRGLVMMEARAVASKDPYVAQVLMHFAEAGGTLPAMGVLVSYKAQTSEFISAVDCAPDPARSQAGLGALPFMLATPSYCGMGTVRDTDPEFRRLEDRRQQFSNMIFDELDVAVPMRASGTVNGTPGKTRYGTSEKTSNNGTDWEINDDYSQDQDYDEITVD
jgi:hypothetical protein